MCLVSQTISLSALTADCRAAVDWTGHCWWWFHSFPRSVLVVGVLAAVQYTQPLCFLDKRFPVVVSQLSPESTESFADLRIVKIRLDGDDLAPLDLRPDHERIHRTTDPGSATADRRPSAGHRTAGARCRLVLLAVGRVRVRSRRVGVDELRTEDQLGIVAPADGHLLLAIEMLRCYCPRQHRHRLSSRLASAPGVSPSAYTRPGSATTIHHAPSPSPQQ